MMSCNEWYCSHTESHILSQLNLPDHKQQSQQNETPPARAAEPPHSARKNANRVGLPAGVVISPCTHATHPQIKFKGRHLNMMSVLYMLPLAFEIPLTSTHLHIICILWNLRLDVSLVLRGIDEEHKGQRCDLALYMAAFLSHARIFVGPFMGPYLYESRHSWSNWASSQHATCSEETEVLHILLPEVQETDTLLSSLCKFVRDRSKAPKVPKLLTDKSTSNTKAKAAHPKDCCNRSGCLYSGHLRVMQLTCSSIGHFKM